MKHFTIPLLCIFVALLLLLNIGCEESTEPSDQETDRVGLLKLGMDISAAPTAVISLDGMLYRNNFDTIYFDFEIAGDSAIALVENIPVGIWMLEVNAYIENNILAYTGTAAVEIRGNQINPVSINLEAVTGSLHIKVTWDVDATLIAYYPFSGNANDESNYANHGTVIGATLVPDRNGNPNSAYSFDGMDDYIDLGDVLNTVNIPFTVSAWMYCLSNDGGKTIIHSDLTTPPQSNYYGFDFSHSNRAWDGTVLDSSQLRISYGDGGGASPSSRRTKNGSSFVPLNRWVHVAAIVEGPTEMSIFLNGQKDGGVYSGSGGDIIHSPLPAWIGVLFHGYLDEIRIYSRALTDQEIQKLFQ